MFSVMHFNSRFMVLVTFLLKWEEKDMTFKPLLDILDSLKQMVHKEHNC